MRESVLLAASEEAEFNNQSRNHKVILFSRVLMHSWRAMLSQQGEMKLNIINEAKIRKPYIFFLGF